MLLSFSTIERLLAWFQENGRHSLPWRLERSPYRVWISEIMLQQTQVQTVLGYYSRFLSAFPDVSSLAEAEEEVVLRHWEGLGYYRRARLMHVAAKKINTEFNGVFPTRFADIFALPGVGRYTAGAILSFAFDERFPILEANTQRLFARLNALNVPTASREGQKILWKIAEDFISPNLSTASPCAINTALMDIGNLICLAQNPQCDVCPLLQECESYAQGLVAQIPISAPKILYENRNEVAVCIMKPRKRGEPTEVCLLKYVSGEWWAGLWDFPRTQVDTPENREFVEAFVRETTGLNVSITQPLGVFRHSVTHYKITLNVFCAEINMTQDKSCITHRETTPSGGEIRWFQISELDSLPLCTTGRKIVRLLW